MRIILSTRTQEWGGREPKNKIIKVSVDTSHMQPAFVGTTKKNMLLHVGVAKMLI